MLSIEITCMQRKLKTSSSRITYKGETICGSNEGTGGRIL